MVCTLAIYDKIARLRAYNLTIKSRKGGKIYIFFFSLPSLMNVIGNHHPHRGLKSQDWKCELSRTRNQTCKINIHRAKDTVEFQDMDLSSSGDLQKKRKKEKENEKETKVLLANR